MQRCHSFMTNEGHGSGESSNFAYHHALNLQLIWDATKGVSFKEKMMNERVVKCTHAREPYECQQFGESLRDEHQAPQNQLEVDYPRIYKNQ